MDQIREEQIKVRAYQLWEDEGRPHGKHAEHRRRAEQEYDGNGSSAGEAVVTTDQMDDVTKGPKKHPEDLAVLGSKPSEERKGRGRVGTKIEG